MNWHMSKDQGREHISYFYSDYPCSDCDQWCKPEKELKRHMKEYHERKLYSSQCNKCDVNAESMNIGQNVQVSCNICNEREFDGAQ